MLLSQSGTPNILLRKMVTRDFALIRADLEPIKLTRGMTLARPDESPEHIYFLEAGVASIVTPRSGGKQAEVGLFGREGMSSSSIVLGVDRSPFETFIQVDGGNALRIRRGDLVAALDESDSLGRHLRLFVHCLACQVSYTASSNGTDSLERRLARWLLMCHDRVEGDDVRLTHQFLGLMLAVRRAGVTNTLAQMQNRGAIDCRRGTIRVISRPKLESCAGGSYGIPEAEYRRLIGK